MIYWIVSRRKYKIKSITVNRRHIHEVIIDPHYEDKHGDSIDDQLILRLVKKLDGRLELPVERDGVFNYFVTLLELDGKQYRLI